ncbi:conjugative transposon protein TraK [Chondrinema litorale]|uniref:conjugative transposon protein TraK n=1 Tax=Chondrinema litorale TaxID=2994555 RepID=UPI0025434744|nr:conjugative transposon protein TraK [Chondrinema litorale]UZR99616.1 conjugative transposon protein TraK [Chondrinema litorale]
MLIRNLENKMKLAFAVSIGSFITSIVIVAITFGFAYQLVIKSQGQIYVLDGSVPQLATQTDISVNREVEYQSHINLFHMLFFNLPPDDEFMKENISKAMYLIDKSGQIEYNNLKEKGYYNAILASSAILSIRTDSIKVDMEKNSFMYYGTQRIERETSILKRSLITSGNFKDVPRTENNPHGVLIENWKTILNKDISHDRKRKL